MRYWVGSLLAVCCLVIARAEETPPPGSPLIDHVPVTTVVRGQPAHIAANVKAQDGAAITSVTVFVRITDAGKPFDYAMSGGPGDGAYATDIPVSLIRGVQRFWYHVDVRDSKGRVSDTVWYPVNIVDGGTIEGAGGGLLTTRNLWIAGGVALAGGAALIIDHNSGGGSGGGSAPPVVTPLPPVKKKPVKDQDDDDDPPAPPPPPPPPPCIVTGSEVVNFEGDSMNPFDSNTPIELYVCGACSNATIRVVGSWGAETTVGPYSNPTCDPGAVIQLSKPRSAPQIGAATIEVFSNGSLIHSEPWPSSDFF